METACEEKVDGSRRLDSVRNAYIRAVFEEFATAARRYKMDSTVARVFTETRLRRRLSEQPELLRSRKANDKYNVA